MDHLLKMANQLKDQLGEAQKKASLLTAKGESGGGLVQVEVNGSHRIVSLRLDQSLLAPSPMTNDGRELLQDLIVAACNQANERLACALQAQVGGLAAGFGLDPANFGGLGG